MDFAKLHSAGNDFVLIETPGEDMDWARLAQAMCHRHFGIGGDGLLLLLPSIEADFAMRIFNADGSEAEACGNGLRCLIYYVFTHKLTKSDAETVTVATAAGIRKAKLYKKNGQLVNIESSMGSPQFKAEVIPVVIKEGRGEIDVNTEFISSYPVTVGDRKLQLNFISMGNPHAVQFTKESVASYPLTQIGPLLQSDELFPKKVNFEVANIISRKLIEVRVWERGVGESLACGSGACAVAVAANLKGYVGDEVDIMLSGGTLGVRWDGQGEGYLSGRAEVVYTGIWPHN
jgi:diaminopimelate epimerase